MTTNKRIPGLTDLQTAILHAIIEHFRTTPGGQVTTTAALVSKVKADPRKVGAAVRGLKRLGLVDTLPGRGWSRGTTEVWHTEDGEAGVNFSIA